MKRGLFFIICMLCVNIFLLSDASVSAQSIIPGIHDAITITSTNNIEEVSTQQGADVNNRGGITEGQALVGGLIGFGIATITWIYIKRLIRKHYP